MAEALAWLAVAGYLAGAWLCLRQRGLTAVPRARWFWLIAGLAMLALGLNKQLDLQTALTAWGRQLARDGGWYGQRRAVQRAFVMGAAGLALVAGLATAWAVRGLGRRVFVVLFGLCVLGLFVVVRAASFHHVDVLLRQPVLGLRLHILLELAGIAIVIAGAGLPRQR